MRTFVGLRCGPGIRKRLHESALDLKRGERVLKVPPIEDLHTTIHFLGNTPQTELGEIGKALEEAAAGTPPIDVTYRGYGAFPNAERPRVLWAGVEEDEDDGRLTRLVERVGEALEPLGFPPERRRFHAHVTLARIRGRPHERVFQALSAPEPLEWGSETLSELKLILSDPAHRPYHYIDLTTVELGG